MVEVVGSNPIVPTAIETRIWVPAEAEANPGPPAPLERLSVGVRKSISSPSSNRWRTILVLKFIIEHPSQT